MAIQHYKGELGEFEYNDEIFSVKQIKDSDNSIYEILSYIGSETDGSKIEIPQGIVDCSEMFMDSALVTPPVIPSSVEYCFAMFCRCHALTSLPLIPENVVVTSSMFAHCTALISVSSIFDEQSHVGVYAANMFYGCKNLETVSSIPVRIIGRSRMFEGCNKLRTQCQTDNSSILHYKGKLGDFSYDPREFQLVRVCCDLYFDINTIRIYDAGSSNDEDGRECLKYIGGETDGSKIEIPQGITDCFFMFAEGSLTIPPVIPDGVVDCTSMFLWNNMLESPPVIPDGVRVCDHMFDSCRQLKSAPVMPFGVEDCCYMFNDCSKLSSASSLPNSVRSMTGMFKGCISLVSAPLMPEGNWGDCMWAPAMFEGCSNLETVSSVPVKIVGRSAIFAGCDKLKLQQQNDATMVHYKGELGEFDYNPQDFCLMRAISCHRGYNIRLYAADDPDAKEARECLRYIGLETDGSKVTIPHGIVDCFLMFAGSTLKTPPVIPDGVKDCTLMFLANLVLKSAPVIPETVVCCSSMFNFCSSLTTASAIPVTVTDCGFMYADCVLLKRAPDVPADAFRFRMFDGCISLEDYETQHKLDNENYDGQHRLMVCADFDEDNSEERNE